MSKATNKVQKSLEGIVTSAKREKTIKVTMEKKERHPEFGGKLVRKKSSYQVHDPDNTCKEGDVVRIKQCRPISKTKTWTLVEVVSRGTE